MYHQTIRQMLQSLHDLNTWLSKAEAHAAAKGFDMQVLLESRLAPDMRPLTYQVQSACDYVKAAAGRLAGETPPRHEDTEKTIADVRARLAKTIAYVTPFQEAQYAGAAARKVALPWKPGMVLGGEDYLVQIIIPNVYFHLTTAYAILRHNGVDLGKKDFLGQVRFVVA